MIDLFAGTGAFSHAFHKKMSNVFSQMTCLVNQKKYMIVITR